MYAHTIINSYTMFGYNTLCMKHITSKMYAHNLQACEYCIALYCIVGMFDRAQFGKFAELSMIRQTKTIQISTYH